jgi:RNA polymerase sigma factor (sigma-70 family)
LEQSELTEEALCRRALHKPTPVDEAVSDNIRMERLNRAIMELPEIQRRRFMLHFDLGLTYEQIGAMEGCTKMPIKRSIDRAIEKIRLALKNF